MYSAERYRQLHPVPTRKCRNCGKHYKAIRKLCCSDTCQEALIREYQRVRANVEYQSNPKKYAKKLREWRRKNPGKVGQQRKRTWAKIRSDPDKLKKKHRRDLHYYEKKRRPPPINCVCPVCSQQFTTHRSYQKYCSLECQGKALLARAKLRRQQGLDPYYTSDRRREITKQYRDTHRDERKRWNQEQKKRIRTDEYWEERLKRSNYKGERLWLQRSKLTLSRIRRLIQNGNPDHVVKAQDIEQNAGPCQKASPSRRGVSRPRSSLPA